jgi:hypothetical protein
MFGLKIRGVEFIFETPHHLNLENVVYKIETDRGQFYIGSTTTTLHDRCDSHCISKKAEKRNIHSSIFKKANVYVLYQTNEKKNLKEIENYVLYQEIIKILKDKNIKFEPNENVFKLSHHFKDVILNKCFDINKNDLRYVISNPNSLNLDLYSKISLSIV